MAAREKDDEVDDTAIWNREDSLELQRPAGLNKYGLTVTSRDWTVETVVKQIENGHIDLDPDFQRRNAWRDARRSRLVESFILGFPVPQIVLAENPRRKGTFIVIDGKQRLMTLAGIYLSAYRSYWSEPRFSGLEVIEGLERQELDVFLNASKHAQLRRQLDNADVRTSVITGFSDEGVLYDIFYRINTGSVPLSSQELRQVLNRGPFAQFMFEVTGEPNPFWQLLAIKEPDARLRDVELLLRLVAWRRLAHEYKGNMKEFLDAAMRTYNDRWVREEEDIRDLVGEVLEGAQVARDVFGPQVGRKAKAGVYEGRLNRAVFEVQAYFLSFPQVGRAALTKRKAVKDAAVQLFDEESFTASVEATTKSVENYRIRFGAYQRMLTKVLGFQVKPLKLKSRAQ